MITPRDRLQKLGDLGRKTMRYWYLLAIFAIAGGALSFAFAITRPRVFQSWSTLFYEERISSTLLQGRAEEVQRNIGDRYRELLMAHSLLEQVVADPKLDLYPEIAAEDSDLKIDKLRLAIHFETRGANAFRITFQDNDAERAKLVTEKLTKLLQDKDEALRNEQAQATVTFASQQKDQAAKDLGAREQALAEFLAKHPEFAQDPNTQGEGAAIRTVGKQNSTKVAPTGSGRLYVLERQRQRIQARLDAPPDAAPVRVMMPATPEKVAAEQAVQDVQRELASAQHDLEDALSKYTDKHPTVINAQERVAAATTKLKNAQAAVPPDVEQPIAPATPEDRVKLQKDLQTLDNEINDEQRRAAGMGTGSAATAAATAAADTSTNWIVKLETEHADLRRQVAETRERMSTLADAAFHAQLDASQKLAEQDRLSVVDPAFKPAKPSGPGKTVFLLAGMVLFIVLGFAIVLGLALIDDRVYRRSDIDDLGLAVLAVIPQAFVIAPISKRPAGRKTVSTPSRTTRRANRPLRRSPSWTGWRAPARAIAARDPADGRARRARQRAG